MDDFSTPKMELADLSLSQSTSYQCSVGVELCAWDREGGRKVTSSLLATFKRHGCLIVDRSQRASLTISAAELLGKGLKGLEQASWSSHISNILS